MIFNMYLLQKYSFGLKKKIVGGLLSQKGVSINGLFYPTNSVVSYWKNYFEWNIRGSWGFIIKCGYTWMKKV